MVKGVPTHSCMRTFKIDNFFFFFALCTSPLDHFQLSIIRETIVQFRVASQTQTAYIHVCLHSRIYQTYQ